MKVYITGTGMISSLGINGDETFKSILAGKTAVQYFPEWRKYNGLHSYLGAPAPAYDISKLSRTARRTMSRMSEMASLAAIQALNQADLLTPEVLNSPRTLLILGSTTGSPETMEVYFKKLFERGGPEGQFSTSFFKTMNHTVPANVAGAIEFHGALLSTSCACATSSQAIIVGWELMQAGLYDVVIAGGADELHYASTSVFDIVMAASRNYHETPDLTPRPFDQARDGLVVSEGAGVVILESEAHVKKRKAQILAQFNGGAYLCDSSHMSQSSQKAMVQVMGQAMIRSKISENEVDYVNAHATGTRQGDPEEAKAIGEVFGPNIPVSSLKGHLGHSMAACGAIEVIACVKMMQQEVLLPTRNLTQVDPSCAGVKHILENTPHRGKVMLSNNFAFGGMNTSLLVSKPGVLE
jgi:3-oxoacyl-[acyl-carrier-protein] synthase II